ncbi:MAG: glycosyltransferase [Paramuribaculum sp.]|nr:glycosyltransferase [Paramuribaculum sp.]
MKVLFQSRQTLFSVPGGDTTQILKTKEYLEKLGIIVDISLDLNPDLSEYDIVHVFNLMRPQDIYLQVKNAVKHNTPVALSTIYGPYEEYEKKARGGILQKLNQFLGINQIEYLKVLARAVINKEFSKGTLYYLLKGHRRLQKEIINHVDVFLPNSHSEMRRVESDFKIHNLNYVSVPNAVDISKFSHDDVKVDEKYEKYRDCVLCVARIEGRKNQLNLVKAAQSLPYHFVFIGKPGANFKKYYQTCLNESSGNCTFLGQIPHEELPQFYKLCRVHVLPSWMETPGLSSLEAGVMNSNIVVTEKGDTRDYFDSNAWYCDPENIESIASAVKSAYEAPVNFDLKENILQRYKWEDTAIATLEGYKSILK